MNVRTRRMEVVLEVLSACCLIVLMILVLIDVIGRDLFNRPLPWGTELLEVIVGALVFLLYPILGLHSGHLTVDLIPVESAAVRRAQRVLGGIVGAIVFALISWCMGRQALRSMQYNEASPLLGIPTGDVLAGMSLLGAVTCVAFIMGIGRSWRAAAAAPVDAKAGH